jgi:hypothetical protein
MPRYQDSRPGTWQKLVRLGVARAVTLTGSPRQLDGCSEEIAAGCTSQFFCLPSNMLSSFSGRKGARSWGSAMVARLFRGDRSRARVALCKEAWNGWIFSDDDPAAERETRLWELHLKLSSDVIRLFKAEAQTL